MDFELHNLIEALEALNNNEHWLNQPILTSILGATYGVCLAAIIGLVIFKKQQKMSIIGQRINFANKWFFIALREFETLCGSKRDYTQGMKSFAAYGEFQTLLAWANFKEEDQFDYGLEELSFIVPDAKKQTKSNSKYSDLIILNSIFNDCNLIRAMKIRRNVLFNQLMEILTKEYTDEELKQLTTEQIKESKVYPICLGLNNITNQLVRIIDDTLLELLGFMSEFPLITIPLLERETKTYGLIIQLKLETIEQYRNTLSKLITKR